MSYLDRHPTAMQRVAEHRLQHERTVGSGRALSGDGKVFPAFGGGKPYPPPLPDREEYVVEFDGHNDPRHAQNWPMKKRMGISLILIFCAFCCTFASSIMAPTAGQIEAEFNVGAEVATLGTSLFVLGYALGPLIFAPMSELFGRRLPIISSMFGFGVFSIGVAVAKDFQTLIICRFFAGCFGSSPLTIVAAIFSDMFDNRYRGLSVACFSAMVINGPLLGPFIGGFITKSYLGWRWTSYLTAIMGFTGCILTLIFEKESYAPIILTHKAAELRRLTHNWGIHAKQEEVEVDFNELVNKNISRPLRILFTEPIVLFVTIYLSFLYGLLYLSITAYDIIFAEVYRMPLGVSGLPYFGMVVGDLIGFVVIATDVPRYNKKLAANNGIPVPEWRMPIAMAGGISFTIGLFWLGWTGFTPSIPWIVPTLSGLCLGFGIYTVFVQCLNYIVDSYLMFAASAVAANTIMRSTVGAIFPLFATYMFKGIGINWGMTLLGCVAALFIPMPFVFYFHGKKIRAKSKFAPAIDLKPEGPGDEESGLGGDSSGEETLGHGSAPSEKEE